MDQIACAAVLTELPEQERQRILKLVTEMMERSAVSELPNMFGPKARTSLIREQRANAQQRMANAAASSSARTEQRDSLPNKLTKAEEDMFEQFEANAKLVHVCLLKAKYYASLKTEEGRKEYMRTMHMLSFCTAQLQYTVTQNVCENLYSGRMAVTKVEDTRK